jgi:TonB family protein
MSDTPKPREGQLVDGRFLLLRYLGGSEHSDVFLTEIHEGERLLKAAIKLIPAVGENEERQLLRWRLAAGLSDPHLIPLFDMGRCELDGRPLLYVVMECAEENLAQILPDRALTPAEAREMLDSVLDVLTYLHGKGLVHGHIKPTNIMANGDQLKLSSDGLCRAGELLGRPGRPDAYDSPENAPEAIASPQTMSPAGDVWSLGITLVETMTQTLPVARAAEQWEQLPPQTMPEPYLDIARHCLQRRPQDRWTVAQIAARLQNRTPGPVAPAPAPPPRLVATRHARPPAMRRGYGIPVTAGVVLLLVAIVAGPRLFHNHSKAPPTPTATLDLPPVPPAAKQLPQPQPQRERPTKTPKPSAVEKDRNSERPTPVPALAHPEPLREEPTETVAKLPAGAVVHGEVAQQVLPDVLESARNTIRGTVKVRVNVDVDRSGNVEGADLQSPGPSKYFARAALQAAQQWKFKPANIGGQGVLSSWTLRFEFTRDGTRVIPTQESP